MQCYYPLAKPRTKSENVGGAAEDGAQPEVVEVVERLLETLKPRKKVELEQVLKQ